MRRRIAKLATGAAICVLAVAAGWQAFSRHGAGEPPAERGSVLFATTRGLVESGGPSSRFGGARGPLRYGQCTVGYRPLPLARDLARSVDFFVPTDIKEVDSVSILDRGGFDHALGKRGDGPVVLFVHGYAYGFRRTCWIGSELQRRIGDEATVVMFSWPSNGNPADYVADRSNIEWSVPQLAGLIEALLDDVGADRLRLLAHSLGTRGVLSALDELDLAGRQPPYADHLVLLAPDFDTARYRHRHERLRQQVARITLYASRNDTPLLLSETLHGHPRLGQAGDQLFVADGVTTIDVSPLGRYHPSGHEYFFYHPVAAEDLVESLLRGTSPDRRRHARPRTLDGKHYWVLVDSHESSQ